MSKTINLKIMKNNFFFNLKFYLTKKKIIKKKYSILFYNAVNNYYNWRLKPIASVYLIPADDLINLYNVKIGGKVNVAEMCINRWFFFKANRS